MISQPIRLSTELRSRWIISTEARWILFTDADDEIIALGVLHNAEKQQRKYVELAHSRLHKILIKCVAKTTHTTTITLYVADTVIGFILSLSQEQTDGELPNALETGQFLLVLNEFSVSYAFQISKNVNTYHKISLYSLGDHEVRYGNLAHRFCKRDFVGFLLNQNGPLSATRKTCYCNPSFVRYNSKNIQRI